MLKKNNETITAITSIKTIKGFNQLIIFPIENLPP